MAAYGAPVVDREWIVGEDSVRDVIRGAGLECKDVFVTGAYRRREYRVEEAEKAWERVTRNPVSDVGGMGAGDREGAKRVLWR